MTRQALEDAYIAGFNNGRDSVGKVSDDDAATHCLLGFDGWWSASLDTLNRAPSVPDPDGWIAWDGSSNAPHGLVMDDHVEVKLREPEDGVNKGRVGGYRWKSESARLDDDIVAYRIIK